MSGNENAAHFYAILGVTGCGKSYQLKKMLARKKRPRTFIWSPKERKDNYAAMYPGSVVCRTVGQVLKVLDVAGKRGRFNIVFVPTLNETQDREQFSTCCKALMIVENCALIVEELHSVTRAGNASHGWRMVCFMGRASGLDVFGLSQRPASVDKAFMGSLSGLHVGELPHPPDQKTCAEILGVPMAEVAALCGYQAIQKDMRTKKLTRIK